MTFSACFQKQVTYIVKIEVNGKINNISRSTTKTCLLSLLIDQFQHVEIQLKTMNMILRPWGINIGIFMSLFPRASK